MRSEMKKAGGPKVKGLPQSPLSSPSSRILKDSAASAANAADRAASIHQMKSDTEAPSNNPPTLVNVGRRKVVNFARRLTALGQLAANSGRWRSCIGCQKADARGLKYYHLC
jgi:hypothetical protein